MAKDPFIDISEDTKAHRDLADLKRELAELEHAKNTKRVAQYKKSISVSDDVIQANILKYISEIEANPASKEAAVLANIMLENVKLLTKEEDILRTYNDIIQRFAQSDNDYLRRASLKASFGKVEYCQKKGENERALGFCDEIMARFGDSEDKRLSRDAADFALTVKAAIYERSEGIKRAQDFLNSAIFDFDGKHASILVGKQAALLAKEVKQYKSIDRKFIIDACRKILSPRFAAFSSRSLLIVPASIEIISKCLTTIGGRLTVISNPEFIHLLKMFAIWCSFFAMEKRAIITDKQLLLFDGDIDLWLNTEYLPNKTVKEYLVEQIKVNDYNIYTMKYADKKAFENQIATLRAEYEIRFGSEAAAELFIGRDQIKTSEHLRHDEAIAAQFKSSSERLAHPGSLVKNILDIHGVSVAAAALRIGISVNQLYRVIRGSSDISADLAVKFEQSGLGGSASEWMAVQSNYSISNLKVRPHSTDVAFNVSDAQAAAMEFLRHSPTEHKTLPNHTVHEPRLRHADSANANLLTSIIEKNKYASAGAILKIFIHEMMISVIELSNDLSTTRPQIYRIFNEYSDISPDMALRLESRFGTPAEVWLRHQLDYNLNLLRSKGNASNPRNAR